MSFNFHLVIDELNVSVNSEGRLIKKYHRQYLCKNATEMSKDAVAAAVGIQPGAPHIEWSYATCHEIDIKRRMTKEPHCAWDADYHWSTEGVAPQSNSSTNPVDQRVNRDLGIVEQQRFIIKDRHGVLLTDTAGSPFDGGVPVTVPLGTITWVRDEAHDGSSLAKPVTLSGHINLTLFMGCVAGTLLLKVTATEKWENNSHNWTTTYLMTYDPDGWNPKPANAGLNQKVGSLAQRILIDGTKAQEPVPLDAAGVVVPVSARPGACIFVYVDYYPQLEFSTLGLPTT